MHKTIIRASIIMQTGIDVLMSMPVEELFETLKEVAEVVRERQRVRIRN